MIYVPIYKLEKDMVLAQDVKLFYPINILLLKKNCVLSMNSIERLRLFDVPGAYILDGTSKDPATAVPLIDEKTKTASLSGLKNVFAIAEQDPHRVSAKDIQQLSDAVSQIVDNIVTQQDVMVNISDLKSYDDYTYHHSLSVALLAVAVAQELRLPRGDLLELGMASMLHDIGKITVPLEILNKPARLTNEEFGIIKTHSTKGAEYLLQNSIGNGALADCVKYHHEKWDGNGYPDRLSAKDIPLFSRIISVADVYDALTSNRPYRKPMLPAEAAEYLMGNCGSDFDFDIVNAFIHKVEFYPVGTCVELSNGRKYVVVDSANALRPVLRSVDSSHETVDLYADRSALSLIITHA